MRILKGDATSPQAKGPKIVAHVCNDIGGWGAGFVVAVSKRWREPERDYRQWHRQRAANEFGLGAVRLVQVQPGIWVANMIGQHGIRTGSAGPPIRYEAVEQCLHTLGDKALEPRRVSGIHALGASVHMPRIGCGLAGGTWAKVGPIVERTLCERDVEVIVYDFG